MMEKKIRSRKKAVEVVVPETKEYRVDIMLLHNFDGKWINAQVGDIVKLNEQEAKALRHRVTPLDTEK